MTAVLRERMAARIVGPEDWVGIPVTFAFDTADPFAVRAELAGVPWLFARDLLRDSLTRPTGYGDVRLWPCLPGAVFLHLRSPSGEVVVELDHREVAGFVSRTAALVPFGSEVMDLDDELAGGEA